MNALPIRILLIITLLVASCAATPEPASPAPYPAPAPASEERTEPTSFPRSAADGRTAVLDRGLAHFRAKDYESALLAFEEILSHPIPQGTITDYRQARREWETRTRRGEIDVPFSEAVDRGLLPVDRPAMFARWYGRLAGVLQRGPGFEKEIVAETEHYRIVTDLPEPVARLLADRLETALVAYRRLFPAGEPVSSSRFAVTVFSQRQSYFRYLAEILDDRSTAHLSGGSYHSVFQELILARSEDLDRTFLVLFHEGFHQYLDAVLGHRAVPPWFGEGVGDYFGAKLTGGRHPFRTEALRAAVADPRPLGIRALIRADHSTFMGSRDLDVRRRKRTVARNYALAYALAHYLAEGDAGRSRPVLRTFFDALRGGRDGIEALHSALGDLVLEELEAEVREHARADLLE